MRLLTRKQERARAAELDRLQRFQRMVMANKRASAGARFLDMAAGGRLTQDWQTATQTSDNADAGLRLRIDIMRQRARELCSTDGYAKRFLTLAAHNAVGAEGFKFQSRVTEPTGKGQTKPDYVANAIIEEAWAEFSKRKNAMVDGQLSLRALELALVQAVARDGEAFVRLYRRGKYGVQLQLIEPELVDTSMTGRWSNGNRVSMGVELDEFGRPVAYHLRKLDMTVEATQRDRIRVPAEDMLHVFIKERPTQSRGITWLAPVGIRMHMLDEYESAALVNARTGAAKMGFLYSEAGAEQYTGDGTDASGNTITNVSAGTIERLPDGLKFQGFEPDFPQSQYGEYVRSVLRGVAAGLGVSYNSLAHDLESVNYSSIRAGVLEERETWKALQALLIENFMEPLFESWLEMALLTKAINLPVAKLDKFNKPSFTGRRWPWVDPLNDVQANVLAIENGLKTRTEVMAEQGKDFEEQMKVLQQEQQIAADLDVTLGSSSANPAPASAQTSGSVGDNNAQK